MYRSPDILLTQILIETVSTIFVLLILFFMPAFKRDGQGPMGSLTNLAIAVAVGLTMFLYVLYTTSDTFRNTDNWARSFLDATNPVGGGNNPVNVVIVDFRATDTTGEITVLTVVGLVVFGLLRTRRKAATMPQS
jgi:multisubunit Na+/H+ antiporter MnhB subunit